MNRLSFIVFYITLLLGCATFSKKSINTLSKETSKVIVSLSNISNNGGNLLVFIHDNEYSYYNDDDTLSHSFKPFRMKKIVAKASETQVIFEHVPHGSYAISAYHDEDADGGLDRMIFPFIGMPSESYGISNGVFSYFSKGSFQKALVTIDSPTADVYIELSSHLSKTFGE